jgi:hypothetical protein
MRATGWFGQAVVALGICLGVASNAMGDVFVNGHYRGNGTYVQPHWRSNPDGIPSNNFSYPGNLNPYTGRTAPQNPFTGTLRPTLPNPGYGIRQFPRLGVGDE